MFNRRSKLKVWGLVLVRCTYLSQSDWDIFLSVTKQRVRKRLFDCNSSDLWETLTWTVIEDDKLDGAGIAESCDIFDNWVRKEGVEELTGSLYGPMDDEYVGGDGPTRYDYYVHVDSLTVQSVVSDHKRGVASIDPDISALDRTSKNYLVVYSHEFQWNIGSWESFVGCETSEGVAPRWSNFNEEDQFSKRVKGTDVLNLYVNLLYPIAYDLGFLYDVEKCGEGYDGEQTVDTGSRAMYYLTFGKSAWDGWLK